jgi:hypothetical protein
MFKRLFSSALFILSSFYPVAHSWGPIGHIAIATIAQNNLSNHSLCSIQHLIPEQDLPSIANWADHIKNQPEWHWSYPLHFIDTPDWACNYVPTRDCYNQLHEYPFCVDGAIQNFTNNLIYKPTPEDLKFLVHFVGDIHQPLHCGFTSDSGGNHIKVHFNNLSTNLHSVWDSNIIEKRIQSDFNDNQDLWISYLLNQSIPMDNCIKCSEEWGNQSSNLACKYSYVNSDGSIIQNNAHLDNDYYERSLQIIEKQIIIAGLRLANILNLIFS